MLAALAVISCGENDNSSDQGFSSAKAITAFSFTSPVATGTIDENAKTISATVPYGTNVTALVAMFTTTGTNVKVGATVQESGTTPNDFTNPVSYVVTATDSSTATYTVIVKSSVINLPKTGQTTSYAEGDDGALLKGAVWPIQRFTDNADDTITDNLTGLMWLKDANCAYTYGYIYWPQYHYVDGRFYWQDALDFVAGINTGKFPNCAGGHNDWRLPNLNELESLVNSGPSDLPSWLNSQGFNNVQTDGYWSSTTTQHFSTDPPAAWYVYMDGGGIGGYGTTYGFYAWPVRGGPVDVPAVTPKTGQTACYDNGTDVGGRIISCATTSAQGQDGALQSGVAWPDPRFTDNGDGTITDNLTGLMWLKDANCVNTYYPSVDSDGTAGDGAVTWQHSLDFLAGINIGTYPNCAGGHTDWRLPNRIELRSLTDYSQSSPALPSGHPFNNVQPHAYWSSSTCVLDTNWAWYVNMTVGVGPYSSKTDSYYVWPVRAGQ